MDKATIFITLEGVSYAQAKRCELIVRQLFEAGIFNVKSGKVILHFDKEGFLGQVDMDIVKWRRSEKSQVPLETIFDNATIELTSNTHDKERVS